MHRAGYVTIHFALRISDLTPLTQCTRLKKLHLYVSRVSDLSVLSSMPLLEEVNLKTNRTSIKDLSSLIHCKMLRVLDLSDNDDVEDLSPLAHCTQLEKLWMPRLTKITDSSLCHP
jgi:Leucine-rich repeat (LRR) protein